MLILKRHVNLMLYLMAFFLTACGGSSLNDLSEDDASTPTPEVTATPTAAPSNTPTATPQPTVTPIATSTPTNTPSPTPTVIPTTTPTPAPLLSDLRYYVFGHSLFTWDAQTETGSTAESSTGYWLGLLANENGLEAAGTGQFGQLSYHSIPSSAQWGFTTNSYDPWPSGSFAEADFNTVVIMPSNFEQTTSTPEQYMNDTNRVISWVVQENPNAQIVLYQHWPEPGLSGPVTNGARLTNLEWNTYKDYTVGGYHQWFITWQNLIHAEYPNARIRMIPIGPVITDLLNMETYMATVTYTDLYADDAPHGRRSLYLLAALVFYTALYGESPSDNYPPPESMIIPEIRNNFPAILTFISERLTHYNNNNGVSVY